MFTHDVVIWQIRLRPTRAKPYEVRWKTDNQPHSKSFVTSALADNFRSDLRQAAKNGELFEVESGLPRSILEHAAATVSTERRGMTWFELARKYVADRWEDDAAKMREGIVDALATATLALLDDEAVRFDRTLVRPAMRWALIPTGLDQHPEKYAPIIKMLSEHTLLVAALATPEVSQRLRKEIARTADGRRAATDTARGRRRKLNTALEYAVDLGELAENPLHIVEGRRVKEKKVARDVAIDPRVVANPRQVLELLTGVSYVGSQARARGRRLVAFYATIYYAGCRPSEAIALRRQDCHLPETGWGRC